MTPWTVAHQAPLSMGFSRQEYWSGLPSPSPGHLPNPAIEPVSPALQTDSLPLSHWGTSKMWCRQYKIQDMPSLGEQRHAWLLMHLLAHWDAEHLSIDSYFSPPLKVRRRETQVWWQFSQLWKTGIIPRSGRGDGANVHSRK